MSNDGKNHARATEHIRSHYQRLAPKYDRSVEGSEQRYSSWRRDLWAHVIGTDILEVGVGTGRNMPFYPVGRKITAIDLTAGMLDQARERAASLSIQVKLEIGDVQSLSFPDNSFDAAVATFVFCSVPDPVSGLRELRRVVKPSGQVLLLEHMRSSNPILGLFMDLFNPISLWTLGDNINHRTLDDIQKAGLVIEEVTDKGMGGIFKQILVSVQK